MSEKNVQLKDYEVPIEDNYILDQRKLIGIGSFGNIYEGRNTKSNEEIAIKIEPTRSKHPQLLYESKIIMSLQGGIGIPMHFWHGTRGIYNILIMELVGQSLENLFKSCNRKFNLLTTLMLADQMLSRIEFIHNKNFIHRDIKPDNFLMGRGNKKHQVYLVDFGLAKVYHDQKTGLHIPYKDGKSLSGTARYASINTHLGIEQARRDDIEALGYILVYFMKGNLPWQGLKDRNSKDKYLKIKEKKISTTLDELCQGLPDEFKAFIKYARELKFEDKPDYNYLRNLLRKISKNNKLVFNYRKFDWQIEKEKMDNEQKENNKEKEKERKKVHNTTSSNGLKVNKGSHDN